MAEPREIPGIDVLPLVDARGIVVLFDLWIAGKWVGSRRTADQCADWLTYLLDVEIEPTAGTPW